MPKWNSLYCISLSSWRMLVIKGIQIAIVPFLQRAQCVQFLMELHRYQQGLAQTQGCAELCLTHGSNWPLVELSLCGCFVWDIRFKACSTFLTCLNWNPVWKSLTLLAFSAFWLAKYYGATERPTFSADEDCGKWPIALVWGWGGFFYYLGGWRTLLMLSSFSLCDVDNLWRRFCPFLCCRCCW